jgi:hypothetical protein
MFIETQILSQSPTFSSITIVQRVPTKNNTSPDSPSKSYTCVGLTTINHYQIEQYYYQILLKVLYSVIKKPELHIKSARLMSTDSPQSPILHLSNITVGKELTSPDSPSKSYTF